MTVSVAGFRRLFTEFASTSDDTIIGWMDQAKDQLNEQRLGKSYDLATYLFIAHYIVLGQRNIRVASAGGIPGGTIGPTTSKSVGGVSSSQDVGSIATQGAGVWNSTSYGQRLFQLMRAVGSGPVYRRTNRPRTGFIDWGYWGRW